MECDGRALPTWGARIATWRRDHGSTSVGKGRSVIYRVFMTDEDYVVIDADSPEEAMLKLRDAGLEPVKAESFPVQSTGLILEQ